MSLEVKKGFSIANALINAYTKQIVKKISEVKI